MKEYNYSDSLKTLIITESKVRRAVKNVNSNKASESNETFLLTLHWVLKNSRFFSIVTVLFNVCLNNDYCYDRFKELITITFKKLIKENYSQLKVYKLITLLNTLNKALKLIIVKRINYLTEIFDLFFKTHINGRRITFTEHAVHLILKKIYSVWDFKAFITSMLSLNVVEVFDNVLHAKLLHNFRKRRIFILIVKWVKNFLKDRRIKIKLLKYIFDWIKIFTDILQSSSFSLILYLFYNANLLNICNVIKIKCMIIKWIDDINIIIIKSTARINIEILTRIHVKVMNWVKRHVAVFVSVKYEFIYFTNVFDKHKCNVSLKLFEHDDIKLIKACRFLEIYLNSQFN